MYTTQRTPILILLLSLTIGLFTKQTQAQNIGQQSITYTDSARNNRPLHTEIWYPTTAPSSTVAAPERAVFLPIQAQPNAPMLNQKMPLLLFSHGTGGNRFAHTWFVAQMVKAGYIVVTVDHYGNTSDNKIPREFIKVWERPIDIQYILTQILSTPALANHIDTTRIGGVGFSLGGYTNIALAGAQMQRIRTEPNGTIIKGKLPPEFPETTEQIDFENDSAITASYARHAHHVKDPRIKAFFVLAPAIGFAFSKPEQTATVTAPLYIVAGQGDTNSPATENALVYHKLIPHSQLHLFSEHVNHYVFLNQGTEFGKKVIPFLTTDHPSVDRQQIHNKTCALALEFFDASFSRK